MHTKALGAKQARGALAEATMRGELLRLNGGGVDLLTSFYHPEQHPATQVRSQLSLQLSSVRSLFSARGTSAKMLLIS